MCTLQMQQYQYRQRRVQKLRFKSYLTGEDVPESIGRRRPIAVMMGNDINGAPQSGTGNAGVIYEAPVEGSITVLWH